MALSPAPATGPGRSAERGAALLLAMIVLTLVATVAAGMVWQQQRAIHVEAAERARVQASWILDAGVDYGRWAIRQLAKPRPTEGVAWDKRIEETRLSSLLAADRENSADSTLEAFFEGGLEDAQSRYNLRNVVGDDGKEIEVEVATLQRLCTLAGAPGISAQLVDLLKLQRAPPLDASRPDSALAQSVPLSRIEHLRWLGVDEATVTRLGQLVDLLPERTRLNLNSAQPEVIEAVLGLPRGTAMRLSRHDAAPNSRFNSLQEAWTASGLDEKTLPATRFDVQTSWYYLQATVRLEDRALSTRALLKQEGLGNTSPVHIKRLDRQPVRAPGRGQGASPAR